MVIRNRLATLSISLAITALTVHAVILNGALRVVYRTWESPATPQTKLYLLADERTYPTATSAGYVTTISIAMITYVRLLIAVTRRMRLQITSVLFLLLFTTSLTVVNMSANTAMFARAVLNSGAYTDNLKSSAYVYIWSTTLMLVFLLLIQYFGQRFKALADNLLITHSDGTENGTYVNIVACFSLVFVLVTIINCLLWHGFIYDATDTSSPSWTGVFGQDGYGYENRREPFTLACRAGGARGEFGRRKEGSHGRSCRIRHSRFASAP